MIKGFAIHCHHNILINYCYDYDERVRAIKNNKPLNEQEIRLRLFKMLPEGALKELPERLQKAAIEYEETYIKWNKTDVEWNKADAERVKADVKRKKADAEWNKAVAEWNKAVAERVKADVKRKKADAEWGQTNQLAFHKKWCGCKEWVNGEIVFNK